jgi:hypothetical protein
MFAALLRIQTAYSKPSSMPQISILFGFLLTLLGLSSYLAADYGWIAPKKISTAFIPCVVSVFLMLSGVLALRPAMRKHMMHAAATIALLGVIAPVGRLISTAIQHGITASPMVISQLLMAILCAIFLALCIRSFVMIRRQRTSQVPSV